MNKPLFVPLDVAEDLIAMGYPGHPRERIPYTHAQDFLRRECFLDTYVTTECTVNEILGHVGHIHVLLSYPAVRLTITDAEIQYGEFDFYHMLDLTLRRAIVYYKHKQTQKVIDNLCSQKEGSAEQI
jgi:hypothetical protein